MPNWAKNQLKVEGESSDEFKKRFERFLPEGDETAINTWGTEWDIKDLDYGEDNYYFKTIWSPPEAFLYKASKEFPELTFTLKTLEKNLGYMSYLKLKDGLTLSSAYAREDYDRFFSDISFFREAVKVWQIENHL